MICNLGDPMSLRHPVPASSPWKGVYVFVYVYVSVCKCIYINIYAIALPTSSPWKYVHVHVFVYACIYMYMYIWKCMQSHYRRVVLGSMIMYMYMYQYICLYIHINIYVIALPTSSLWKVFHICPSKSSKPARWNCANLCIKCTYFFVMYTYIYTHIHIYTYIYTHPHQLWGGFD